MTTIYKRTSKHGTLKFYGNLSINGKRVRRFLGHSKQSAVLALKKLEYEYLFDSPNKQKPNIRIKHAILLFIKDLELRHVVRSR